MLANWFDVGFLELQRIDWSSPAVLLERLVGYEAVHEIRSWSDLKNRLDSDRRCYALFHPRMPAEPLIFVEVALVRGLAGSVQRLLDKRAPLLDPKEADTAIFYSISNCQRGLAGISFGNFLIKQRGRRAGRRVSATSRPSPPCRPSPASALAGRQADGERGRPAERGGDRRPARRRARRPKPESGAAALSALLARRGWARDAAVVKALEPVLIRLAARYLLLEGTRQARARPGGAFPPRQRRPRRTLIMAADTSDKGVRESATLMVNYLYDPAKIEDYHEEYAGKASASATHRHPQAGARLVVNARPDSRLELLEQIERKLLWLSAWTIHNANHLRPNRDGLKVGGHQASCASVVSIMTALYFDVLQPAGPGGGEAACRPGVPRRQPAVRPPDGGQDGRAAPLRRRADLSEPGQGRRRRSISPPARSGWAWR